MASEVGKLEELALKRRERLLAMRDQQQNQADSTENNAALPKPVFRSYQPLDDGLKELQLPKVKPVEVIDKVRDQLESAKPGPLVEEVDLMNLAPRKPDWDLKRDCAKKLEKLERRTQRAIAELIRERLMAERDLAAVASWVATEGHAETATSKKTSAAFGPQLPTTSQQTGVSQNKLVADSLTADSTFYDSD